MFEPRIRAMAGLGRLDPENEPAAGSAHVNASCDVLVVGAGPAGLAAALAASAAGKRVILVDDQPEPGGSLNHRDAEIDGMPGKAWVAACIAELRERGQRGSCQCHRLRHLRPQSGRRLGAAAMAWPMRSGASGRRRSCSRPARSSGRWCFANNDLPGVMSAEAALAYLRRHDVLVGERIVVATNNDSAYAVAAALQQAGAHVLIADTRARGSLLRPMASR